MDGSLQLFQAPAIEPLTVAVAKDWARITHDADDDLVEGLVSAARLHVEELTGRALITQTWDYFLDAFPCHRDWPYIRIDVPRPRLISVTHLKYIDADGVLQTIDAADYTLDTKREPGRIVPAYGTSWPGPRQEPNAVQLRFVAGYGPAIEDVPAQIRQAIAVLVSTMYYNREQLGETQMHDVPVAFWQLINQHRVWWL